ncbi:MAG: endonuclease/exonuclease/phosphatase family protein [Alphaproteobacteria bacterium]|nr:endonuclease/exonuclease/phosphatase family protein [Alphaproteobacteria bacterium]
MRIVTLNTWKNEGQYERRLALMAEGLGALAPDVVCLQESFQADGYDTARHLADALGLEVTAAPARRKMRLHDGLPLESASGLAILRRNGALGSGRLALLSDPADGERIGQWADVAPDLRVLNLHLTHLRGPEAARLRAAQLAQALAVARRSGSGLIVAGDLNAPADAPELAQIAAALDLAAAPTLQGERDGHAAYPRAIDHLALVDRGGWAVRSRFRALDTPDPEGWHPSDHAAVVADLERR